jgi:hypothetical protein
MSISSVGGSTAALQQLLSHSAPVTNSDAVDKAAKDAVDKAAKDAVQTQAKSASQTQASKPPEKPTPSPTPAPPAPRPGGVDTLA